MFGALRCESFPAYPKKTLKSPLPRVVVFLYVRCLRKVVCLTSTSCFPGLETFLLFACPSELLGRHHCCCRRRSTAFNIQLPTRCLLCSCGSNLSLLIAGWPHACSFFSSARGLLFCTQVERSCWFPGSGSEISRMRRMVLLLCMYAFQSVRAYQLVILRFPVLRIRG